MTLGHFEQMLKKLHPEFQVLVGRPADLTAGVFFRGERLFTIPNNQIYEKPNDMYGIDVGNTFIRHRTIPDALAMAKKVLKDMQENPDEYEATMGIGKYTDAKLKPGDEQWKLTQDQAYEANQKQTKGGILMP